MSEVIKSTIKIVNKIVAKGFQIKYNTRNGMSSNAMLFNKNKTSNPKPVSSINQLFAGSVITFFKKKYSYARSTNNNIMNAIFSRKNCFNASMFFSLNSFLLLISVSIYYQLFCYLFFTGKSFSFHFSPSIFPN